MQTGNTTKLLSLWLSALMAAGSWSPLRAAASDDAQKLIVKGANAAAEGDWQAALNEFLSAASIDEHSEKALYHVGIAYYHLGKLEQARIAELLAVQANPKFMPPYLELATIETKRNRIDGAKLAVGEALKVFPGNPELLKVQANLMQMSPQKPVPVAPGAKKVTVSPMAKSAMLFSRKDIQGLLAESETALSQGDLPRAKNALQLAIKLSPADPEPHWRLCQLLEAEGDTGGAIAEALNAVGLDKDNPKWYLVLGWAYSRAGKWQPSFDAFKEAFRRDNTLHDAVVGECYALAKQKQNMLARITLHISDPDAHDTSWYHAANGLILEEKGDLYEACKELVRASEIAPNDYQIKYTMARVAYQLACKDNKKQSWKDATEHAKSLLAMMPCDVEVLTNLGVCLLSTGDNEAALKTMEKAVKIAPSNAAAHAAYASVLVATGKLEEARTQAKIAKTLDPAQQLANSILKQLK